MTLLRLKNNKGQATPFLILVIAVLILAIPATMLIGDAAFNRIRMANVGDSALISTASQAARGLNEIRQISFGSGGLLVTYTMLQTFLLAKFSTCPCPFSPGAGQTMYGWSPKEAIYATGTYINAMLTMDRLMDRAEDIADDIPKDLRIAMWDRVLGGGLVDEPKPFIDIPNGDPYTGYVQDDPSTWDEVGHNPEPSGPVSFINTNKWLDRDSQFIVKLREYKKANPGSWYNNTLFSYNYNETKDAVVPAGTPLGETTGVLRPGAEPTGDSEAYFRAELSDMPSDVDVDPQMMLLTYFFLVPIIFCCAPYCAKLCCICKIAPAFTPCPYAWINKVDMDHSSWGVKLDKLLPFSRVPFFGRTPSDEPRNPNIRHSSRVRIQGSVWSGFEPKLEQ